MSIHGVLGENTSYPKTYDSGILYPISRNLGRDEIKKHTDMTIDFVGIDIWQAFEISWLNEIGVSQVAMAKFFIPATSPSIVESKSLKLYLNSLNFTVFKNKDEVVKIITDDLSNCVGETVKVELMDLTYHQMNIETPKGICIDEALNHNQTVIELTDDIDESFLQNLPKGELTTYQFYSNLLRSNCPVTNQPDWGTVQIDVSTECELDDGKILKYILSFRQHNGFHEQCVEQIFAHFIKHTKPTALKVQANYTRRGGIDINPIRVLNMPVGEIGRLVRQ